MYPKANSTALLSATSSSDKPRWVVVHDAERDHYELPIALAEAGVLERFVTDWYTPLDKRRWRVFAKTRMAKSLFGIAKRFRPELPSALTADHKAQFVASYVRQKFQPGFLFDDVVGGRTGRHAAAVANEQGANLFAASYCAATAFEQLRPGLKKVLFQVHPHPRFLRNLYTSQMECDPDYAGLRNEAEVLVNETQLAEWEQESTLADHILCASHFTRRSLERHGIAREKISVIPYGVNTRSFPFGAPSGSGPVKVLFVGQKVARKGLRMLLRVWQQLRPANAELILAGGHIRDESILNGFDHLFTETPRIGHRALIQLFQQADIFVLPSLAEGFGHVYLEALSCGVPIICTENTGGADIIRHGESGWILPAGDPAALAECLASAISQRRQLRDMREAARAVADRYSWSGFREGIRQVLLAPLPEPEVTATSFAGAVHMPATTLRELA